MKKFVVILLSTLFVLSVCCAAYAADVHETGVLRFAVPTDRNPFVYYDGGGSLTGVDIDLMKEIAKRMGVALKITEMSASDITGSLLIDQADVIGGAISKTKARSAAMDFSSVYYAADGVFVSKGIIAQPIEGNVFDRLSIGVLKGSGFEEWIKEELYDRGNVKKQDLYTYDKIDDAMKALEGRRVDVVMIDAALFDSVYAGNSDYLIYERSTAKDNYVFGTAKDSGLAEEINKHLSDMFADGTAQLIASQYLVRESAAEPELLKWTEKNSEPVKQDLQIVQTAEAEPEETEKPEEPKDLEDQIIMIEQGNVPVVVPVQVLPAAQRDCWNDMGYLGDITVPDGLYVTAGSEFTKVWRVMNTGTCTWTTDYVLHIVDGNPMGASEVHLPYDVHPGETVDLSLKLTAPDEVGYYQGIWQLEAPEKYDFGHPVWTEIYVPQTIYRTVPLKTQVAEDQGYFMMSSD